MPSATQSQRAAPSPSYGSPTLPALRKRTRPTRRVLLVRVAAHDDRGLDSAQRVRPPLLGRQPGEHLVVAARAGVAIEHAVDLERQRQLAELPRAGVAELGGGDGGGAS